MTEKSEEELLKELKETKYALGERVKELNFLYELDKIVDFPDLSLQQKLLQIVDKIPPAWQYPSITEGCITKDRMSGKK